MRCRMNIDSAIFVPRGRQSRPPPTARNGLLSPARRAEALTRADQTKSNQIKPADAKPRQSTSRSGLSTSSCSRQPPTATIQFILRCLSASTTKSESHLQNSTLLPPCAPASWSAVREGEGTHRFSAATIQFRLTPLFRRPRHGSASQETISPHAPFLCPLCVVAPLRQAQSRQVKVP